jgi:hypothetical protein
MQKTISVGIACLIAVFLLASCERKPSVEAGNDPSRDTYQPRPAPAPPAVGKNEVKGELLRVDTKGKTFVMRVANGMEQTFMFDDNTIVVGVLTPNSKAAANTLANMKVLAKKPGSEMTVQWFDNQADKMATYVNVSELSKVKKR